jgi:hypothetical protein
MTESAFRLTCVKTSAAVVTGTHGATPLKQLVSTARSSIHFRKIFYKWMRIGEPGWLTDIEKPGFSCVYVRVKNAPM